MVGEEEGEVGGTAEEGVTAGGGEDSGGGVTAEAGEASHPGEVASLYCTVVEAEEVPEPNTMYVMFHLSYCSRLLIFSFFRGGGDNKRKTFDD